MTLRLAAFAAGLACAFAALPARAGETLDLDDAFARVLRAHPDLREIDARRPLLAHERDQAAQRPSLRFDASLENAIGSGDLRALDGAELTLGLSSVLERGAKADARAALVQRRLDGLGNERAARRLDLLAETARRYLDALAASDQRRIALQDIRQREQAVSFARRRQQAGAAPASLVLTARAALAEAELGLDRASHQRALAVARLGALWGEREPSFELADNAPPGLPEIAPLARLEALLRDTPDLAGFTDQRRIAEARLQLARSQSRADIDWSFGVRRLQADDDIGLVAGISIPLGSRGRAAPAIRMAESELQRLSVERESASLSLYATLVEAHGRYRLARLEASRFEDDIIPALERAERDARLAFERGAAGPLEWTQLQDRIVEARMRQLASTVDGQRALIELQRLTGEPLLATPATNPGAAP
ncbi:TolC family protein [Marilutibacter aestuarii]|uniref:TolC family protein n=1 Tax=Marilutibacter aestuarii TaxID=1706195 RepID=A0A507ZWS2_9GAMM|nr:TolC family protein [Lysobacter aestuarii]TQD42170.1 TolC family protein [Lysobacter aestuarii]